MFGNPYQYYSPLVYNQPNLLGGQQVKNLQGKQVDNVEVVKATEIPFDGSVSYFPMFDGSAIFTKQLMQDGTSKINIYKPITFEEVKEDKYVTQSELEKQITALKEEFGKENKNEPNTNN